jgi:hypothetical protein
VAPRDCSLCVLSRCSRSYLCSARSLDPSRVHKWEAGACNYFPVACVYENLEVVGQIQISAPTANGHPPTATRLGADPISCVSWTDVHVPLPSVGKSKGATGLTVGPANNPGSSPLRRVAPPARVSVRGVVCAARLKK